MKIIIFLICLIPFTGFSQEIVLKSVSAPGQSSIIVVDQLLQFENNVGPKKVTFPSNEMILKRQESEKGLFGTKGLGIDELQTFYSGKIFSEDIQEPFIFENKTPEELRTLEIAIFPNFLERPYTLYLSLKIEIISDPISSNNSDDAGRYTARFSVSINKL